MRVRVRVRASLDWDSPKGRGLERKAVFGGMKEIDPGDDPRHLTRATVPPR